MKIFFQGQSNIFYSYFFQLEINVFFIFLYSLRFSFMLKQNIIYLVPCNRGQNNEVKKRNVVYTKIF